MVNNKFIHSASYRADIDGLRAVAVLSVILYHINEKILPGGFIGVDIFFVISGYLITQHIIRDISQDRFSIIEFYKRRIKRIMPAMLTVVFVVLVVSLYIHRPEDTERLAQSGFASLFSMANIYFWLFQDSSYFAAASNQLPLLHLWSLGIEEQYYLFWPLVLVVLYKRISKKTFMALFAGATVSSFVLAELLFEDAPSFVYYMLPTRFGELMIGAIMAYIISDNKHTKVPRYIPQLLAISGALLIASSLFFISKNNVFPGLLAIIPTMGAAFIIASGHYGDSRLKQWLSIRPLVYIGLISYSAYLWHWPLLAYMRYAHIDITLSVGFLVVIMTLLLAWLTYYFVECPTRKYKGSAGQVFAYQFAIPSFLLIVLTILMMNSDGYFLHWNASKYKAIESQTLPAYKYPYVCQKWEISKADTESQQCVVGGENTKDKTNVLLWGDSNAAHYVGVVGELARSAGFAFRNLEHSSCPPIITDPKPYVPAKRLRACRHSLNVVTNTLDQYDVIIVSAAWDGYLKMSDDFMETFFSTVSHLTKQGKLVVLLGKVPPIKDYSRLCNEKSINLTFMQCDQTYTANIPENIVAINNQLKNFAHKNNNVAYYDVNHYVCPQGLCSVYDEAGNIQYYGSTHLSLPGSWRIGKRIVAEEKMLPNAFLKIKERLHESTKP